MKVKNVIASALTLIGRADVASALNGGALNTEGQELVSTLLYCFNAVENELARNYVPLTNKEKRYSPDKKYPYSAFSRYPSKIKRVTVDGATVKFEAFSQFMEVDSKQIIVEYEYLPTKKTLDGDSDYADETGEYLIALGIASEYSLINGEAEMAEKWEKKYRERIDGVQRVLPACRDVPPRRWV